MTRPNEPTRMPMTVVGTIRVTDRGLFIERDGGADRDIFLHGSIAERGGLAAPYDRRRVRCEISRDAFGNCAAIAVAELPTAAVSGSSNVGEDFERNTPGADRGGITVRLDVSAADINQLVDLGYLAEASRSDGAAVADAVVRVMRRVLVRRSRPPGIGAP